MINTSDIAQLAAGGAAGLVAIAFGIQKFITIWQTNRAEGSMLTIMHGELERMNEQNTKLSTELGRLQQEIITLNGELRKLSAENQRLHTEVVSLTNEVTRLQTMLKGA
jgi:chromosome segregation ATPase